MENTLKCAYWAIGSVGWFVFIVFLCWVALNVMKEEINDRP
jgi:hypothetical protein